MFTEVRIKFSNFRIFDVPSGYTASYPTQAKEGNQEEVERAILTRTKHRLEETAKMIEEALMDND